MIKIIDGDLYQWDVGRAVDVGLSDFTHIHFSNPGDTRAVKIAVTGPLVTIPNYLLQTGKQLCVYAVNNGFTVEVAVFPVRKRPRPEDYVYEDDQRNYIYELIQSAEEATAKAEDATAEAEVATAKSEEATAEAERVTTEMKILIDSMESAPVSRLSEVALPASAWVGSNSLYSQVVTIDGITEYSKVDLLPSVEQLAIFHNKDVAFVTENEDGVVTVFAIGDKPLLDYTMQVQITEVGV